MKFKTIQKLGSKDIGNSGSQISFYKETTYGVPASELQPSTTNELDKDATYMVDKIVCKQTKKGNVSMDKNKDSVEIKVDVKQDWIAQAMDEAVEDLANSFDKSNYSVAHAAWNFYLATQEVKKAKQTYLYKLREYDKKVARKTKKKVTKIIPNWTEALYPEYSKAIVEYTKEEYSNYKKAQKRANYLKHKLLNTVKKELLE